MKIRILRRGGFSLCWRIRGSRGEGEVQVADEEDAEHVDEATRWRPFSYLSIPSSTILHLDPAYAYSQIRKARNQRSVIG
jgi:hypothetical protein